MGSNEITMIGLLLDMIGAVVLFFYGLPSNIDKDGSIGLEIDNDPLEAKKWKKYYWISRIGLFLLIAGFIFQFLATLNCHEN